MHHTDPKVGVSVHYHPTPDDGMAFLGGAPLAATITAITGNKLVNLAVFDALGIPHSKLGALYLQRHDARMLNAGGYCEEIR